MIKLPGLLLHRADNGRGREPEAGDAEAAREIEEAVAVDIPHIGALGAGPENGEFRRDVGDVARFMRAQFLRQPPRLRAWDGR